MQYGITAPKGLQHTAQLPASKSISNRALVMHALAGSKTLPDNLSDCDDTEVMVRALRDNPFEIDIKAGDRFLLCSDGLSNMVENDEIRDIMIQDKSLMDITNELVDRANYYGGSDNISAIVVGK